MPRQTADKFMLRLPEGLRDRVREEADRNLRSMNAEIVFHLQKALFDRLETPKGEATA